MGTASRRGHTSAEGQRWAEISRGLGQLDGTLSLVSPPQMRVQVRGAGHTSHKHGRGAHSMQVFSLAVTFWAGQAREQENPGYTSVCVCPCGMRDHRNSSLCWPTQITQMEATSLNCSSCTRPQLRDAVWEGRRSGFSFTGDISWKGSRSLQQPQTSLTSMSTPCTKLALCPGELHPPQAAPPRRCSPHCHRKPALLQEHILIMPVRLELQQAPCDAHPRSTLFWWCGVSTLSLPRDKSTTGKHPQESESSHS